MSLAAAPLCRPPCHDCGPGASPSYEDLRRIGQEATGRFTGRVLMSAASGPPWTSKRNSLNNWSLVHSPLQGTVVALLLAILLFALRRASPGVRLFAAGGVPLLE